MQVTLYSCFPTGMSKLKLISVEDTEYPASLLKSINEQRNNGLFCDVTIIVQDRKFRAHKTVLSASSTYFRQLFSVAGQVIELNFIKADIFEMILNYIYSSKVFRVRSDKLEDLISAGQILGVKFIANLATPLAQVKGLPGLSREGDNNSVNSSEKNGEEHNMPIITESFSLSAEEFKMASCGIEKEVDSDDDDILFVSKTEPPQAQKTKLSEVNNVESERGPDAKKLKVTNDEGMGSKCSADQEGKDKLPECTEKNLPLQNNVQPQFPSTTIPPESGSGFITSPVRTNSNTEPTTPTPMTTPDPHSTSVPLENKEMLSAPKKKALPGQSPDKQSILKLATFSPNNGNRINPVSAKKTITLDKASEIDSLSPGCKVYANIGEDTYDIVPVKEDPGEGAAPCRKLETAHGEDCVTNDSPRGKKKIKQDQDDHYEIVMDGKTFFVCTVCKRPYVCLTSLRRHYNTHSWERKYPCHYCDRVFALAEYRTKHEITHTGERRYQCLLCHETFLNYQILSTHCKQIHNQDPSGRKQKDDSCNNLYRLLPCKTLQLKAYSYVSENSEGIPPVTDDESVQHISPGKEHFSNQALPSSQGKVLNWDDVFAEPKTHADVRADPPPLPVNQINASTTEFEFVIPETY